MKKLYFQTAQYDLLCSLLYNNPFYSYMRTGIEDSQTAIFSQVKTVW